MPFEKSGDIDRTPAYLKRQKSKASTFGYLVEGAGICNGFYTLKNKAYFKNGSDGKVRMKKLRKEWAIHIKDEDNDWEKYYSSPQPKPKPPESGWRNAFDNKPDNDVKVARTLLKNLTEEQLAEIMSGETVTTDVGVKLDDLEAKPAETPQQKRARERMERRKAKMAARRKGGKKGGKKKKAESTDAAENEEEEVKAASPEPTKEEKVFKTPEKKAPQTQDHEEDVESAPGNILAVLFQKLQPRYWKYQAAFEEFGVSDSEMLKEVDNDALVDLGVGSGLERKVMLKKIEEILAGGGEASAEPTSAEDLNAHKSLKLKRTQLQKQVKRLEAKKEKLEKEILQLQRTKRDM